MSKSHLYVANPYGVRVVFCPNRKALSRIATKFDLDVPDHIAGGVWKAEHGTLVMAVLDGDMATLVHECGHACLFVLEHAGMDPRDSEGEAFCYLLDHMFNTLFTYL